MDYICGWCRKVVSWVEPHGGLCEECVEEERQDTQRVRHCEPTLTAEERNPGLVEREGR